MSFETEMAEAYTKQDTAEDTQESEVTTKDEGEKKEPNEQNEDGQEGSEPEEKPERHPAGEKNAQQAAQRREREMQAKIQAAVQQQMDAFYAKQYSGKKNKAGKDITTQAEAEAYEREQAGDADVHAFMDLGMAEKDAHSW